MEVEWVAGQAARSEEGVQRHTNGEAWHTYSALLSSLIGSFSDCKRAGLTWKSHCSYSERNWLREAKVVAQLVYELCAGGMLLQCTTLAYELLSRLWHLILYIGVCTCPCIIVMSGVNCPIVVTYWRPCHI